MSESRPAAAAFLFVIAQPEAKAWLTADLARLHPELRIAFSRPGLYTWKHSGGTFPHDFRFESVFARHHGYSLGQVDPRAPLEPMLATFTEPLRLHVFARDAGEGKPQRERGELDEIRRHLLAARPGRFLPDPTPRCGEWVLDVIVPPTRDMDEPWFLGYHRHEHARSPHPGGVTRVTPPEVAPSRAYSKLEELLRWSSLPMRAGEVAVEFGCAPGGAVVAMMDRGLRVIGVDPAELDPRVVEHARAKSIELRHLACPIAALRREQLPSAVDWLLCDANLAPQVAVRYLAHWAKVLRPHLRGIVFTMKMNDARALSAIPKLLAQVGQFGLGAPRGVQLPSHRHELAVFACRTGAPHRAPGHAKR